MTYGLSFFTDFEASIQSEANHALSLVKDPVEIVEQRKVSTPQLDTEFVCLISGEVFARETHTDVDLNMEECEVPLRDISCAAEPCTELSMEHDGSIDFCDNTFLSGSMRPMESSWSVRQNRSITLHVCTSSSCCCRDQENHPNLRYSIYQKLHEVWGSRVPALAYRLFTEVSAPFPARLTCRPTLFVCGSPSVARTQFPVPGKMGVGRKDSLIFPIVISAKSSCFSSEAIP